MAAANRRTVVVLQGGSAILCSEWDTTVPAIVHAWYGGVDAGGGLADVLYGHAEPGGRLPFSIPVDESHLPEFEAEVDDAVYDRWHGWWHLERAGHRPAYPFGFGLAYTTFAVVDATARIEEGAVVVPERLTNTGDRDGSDVVQVYARLPDGDGRRRLVGFARVDGAGRWATGLRGAGPARNDWPCGIPTPTGGSTPDGDIEIEVARYVGDPDARQSDRRRRLSRPEHPPRSCRDPLTIGAPVVGPSPRSASRRPLLNSVDGDEGNRSAGTCHRCHPRHRQGDGDRLGHGRVGRRRLRPHAAPGGGARRLGHGSGPASAGQPRGDG